MMTEIAEPTTVEQAAETLSTAWTMSSLVGVPGSGELWRAVVKATALLATVVPSETLGEHDVADVLVWGFKPHKAQNVREFCDRCMAARAAGTLAASTPTAPAASVSRRI